MGQWHLRALRALNIADVYLCDPRPDALKAAADEFAVAADRCRTELRQLLSFTNFDLVIIATTADRHCEVTCLAAERGVRFIVCEKPMACSIAECDEMIAACRENGARLAINHQIRFMPAYAEAAQIIRHESFGGLSSMNVVGGNGGLAMIGSHMFETFRWLTGEQIDTVQAWFSPERVPNPRGPQFEDVGGSVRALSTSGRRLYFDLSCDQGHGMTITYTGRWGQVIVDPLQGTLNSSLRRTVDRDQPTTRYALAGERFSKTFEPGGLEAAKMLIQQLIEDGDYPTGENGKHIVECLVAAHISHENGNTPVRVVDTASSRSRRFSWA